MFSDVHRHLVLCMKPLHGHKPRFRQIVVIKTDVFELRILEGEAVQLDQQAIANAAAAEIHAHEALAPAVAHAEKEYIASVRRGWRAFDPSAPSSLDLTRSQAA
jgi:hypothetical protein